MNPSTPDRVGNSRSDFTIKLMQPDDAPGVARLFHSVHQDQYPIKLFYNPSELIAANEKGDYYSVVAKSAEGEIIGIHNLFRSAPSKSVYEWGVGLVSKQRRSQGVSGAIEQFMIESVVPELGMHTVFGEPVTIHLQMQKHSENRGFKPTALEIGLMPGEAYTGEGVTSARVSTLLCFRTYRDIDQQIFLPDTYFEALNFIYKDLHLNRKFSVSGDPIPIDVLSLAEMQIFDFARVARISFVNTGSNFRQSVVELERDALKKNAVVVQIWLKLTSPWISKLVEILREMGYFFGGLLPQWFDDDGILMQKTLFTPDFGSIQIYSDRSKKILDVVKSDWERACGLKS